MNFNQSAKQNEFSDVTTKPTAAVKGCLKSQSHDSNQFDCPATHLCLNAMHSNVNHSTLAKVSPMPPHHTTDSASSLLNNQLPAPLSTSSQCSPSHGIHLGHKNNLQSYSLQLINSSSPPITNRSLAGSTGRDATDTSGNGDLPTNSLETDSILVAPMAPLGLEQLKCKSNLLRVQFQNQCHLVDYGFIESSYTSTLASNQIRSVTSAPTRRTGRDDVNVDQTAIINRPKSKTGHQQKVLTENSSDESSSLSSEPSASSSFTSESSSSEGSSVYLDQTTSAHHRRLRSKSGHRTRKRCNALSARKDFHHSTVVDQHQSQSTSLAIMRPQYHPATSNSANNYTMIGFDSINHRSSASTTSRSFVQSDTTGHQLKSVSTLIGNSSTNLDPNNSTSSPASPCTWRKYLPRTNGQLRLVNHRISAHPDGPQPIELGSVFKRENHPNFVSAHRHNLNSNPQTCMQQPRNNNSTPSSNNDTSGGHLSDTECGRKISSSKITSRESISYGQLLCSPMLSRKSTGSQSKFQSLEKNLKLLKPTLPPSSSSSSVAPRPNTLLRRQASFMSEISGCNQSTHNSRSLSDQRTTTGFGSSLSMASAVTAPLDSQIDRPAGQEMRKLKRELQLSHQKVGSLTNQLNTNAHMVSAFEQSLSVMTTRLAHLSSLSEQKDAELLRLKQIIEQIGGQEMLTTQLEVNGRQFSPHNSETDRTAQSQRNCSLIRRHTFASASDELRPTNVTKIKMQAINQSDQCNQSDANKQRRNKSKSIKKSIKDFQSGMSVGHQTSIATGLTDSSSIGLQPKNSWFRASLNKAFRKQKLINEQQAISPEDSSTSGLARIRPSSQTSSESDSAVACEMFATQLNNDSLQNVDHLRQQLKEKETQLTELRLESLNGAHQLDSLRELVEQLRGQLSCVQQENERLCKLMQQKSLASSKSSIHSISSGGLNVLPVATPTTSSNNVTMFGTSNISTMATGNQLSTNGISPEATTPVSALNTPISSTGSNVGGNNASAAHRTEVTNKGPLLFQSLSCGSSCSTNSSTELGCRQDSQSTAAMLHEISEQDEFFGEGNCEELSISWASCDLDREGGTFCSLVLPDWIESESLKTLNDKSEILLGRLRVTSDTSWSQLDAKVRARLSQYLSSIDPEHSLGITLHSFTGFRLGDEQLMRVFGGSSTTVCCNNARSCSMSLRNSAIDRTFDRPLSTLSAEHQSLSASNQPLLLPFAYLVNNDQLSVCLGSHVDHFCLYNQLPRSTFLRFLALLGDHRKLLLHGPTGSGKSELARLLAEFLVQQSRKSDCKQLINRADLECCIASYQVTTTNGDEFASYLASVAEQFQLQMNSSHQMTQSAETIDTLPAVLIIDDLQHVKKLDKALAPLLSLSSSPYIIATMTDTASQSFFVQPLTIGQSSALSNFRLLHCAVHTEPVRGHLRRALRRRLVEHLLQQSAAQQSINDCGCWLPAKRCSRSLLQARQFKRMTNILDWLVNAWKHVNHFLETHNSVFVTLGPRIFVSCPVDSVESVRHWFEELWNSSVAPYLIQAARDGLRKNQLNNQFEDPSDWIERTYPWRFSRRSGTIDSICSSSSSSFGDKTFTFGLRRIQAEDIHPGRLVSECKSEFKNVHQSLSRCSIVSTSDTIAPTTTTTTTATVGPDVQDCLSESLSKLQKFANYEVDQWRAN